MRSGSVFSTSGKSPGIEEMLKRLISVVVGPESDRRHFSLPVAMMVGGTPRWSVPGSLAKENTRKDSLSREMTNDPGGGSASRISHTSRPTDPGGGSSAASNEKSEPVFGFCPQGTPKNTGGVRMNNLAHRWAVNRFIN